VPELDQLLRHAVEQRASDVHLKVGSRPHLRIDGRLVEAPFELLEPEAAERLAFSIMPEAKANEFRRRGEVDFVYAAAGLGRFRVDAFRQRGWVGLVLRRVLPGIPGFDALGLPEVLAQLAEERSGLVLVTGLAGSGRTSTLAAMVDQINQHSARHVVTIEDPIEVLHPDKAGIVDQREVGTDTASVVDALAHALRQDPDVIVVSALREAAAARAALEAADIGHLVLAGMTTVSTVDSITRFIDFFAPHQQRPVRCLLARALRGVVCQRLLPRAGGRGRVPAVEVLVVNGPMAQCLAAEELDVIALEYLLAGGEYYGMQTFDESLSELYRRGLISLDVAVANASSPVTLRPALEAFDRTRLATGVVAPPPPAPPPLPVAPAIAAGLVQPPAPDAPASSPPQPDGAGALVS